MAVSDPHRNDPPMKIETIYEWEKKTVTVGGFDMMEFGWELTFTRNSS